MNRQDEKTALRRAVRARSGGLEALRRRHPTWSLCAISADMSYERHAGRRADKKRRYYNGRLECDFLTFGPAAGKGR